MLVLMKLSWCIHTIRIYPVSSPPGEGMTQHVESRISQGLSTSMCLCCFEIDVSNFSKCFFVPGGMLLQAHDVDCYIIYIIFFRVSEV